MTNVLWLCASEGLLVVLFWSRYLLRFLSLSYVLSRKESVIHLHKSDACKAPMYKEVAQSKRNQAFLISMPLLAFTRLSSLSSGCLAFLLTAALVVFAYRAERFGYASRRFYPELAPPGADDATRLKLYTHAARHAKLQLPAWLTTPLPRAHMSLENSVHYDLDTPLGEYEWNNATLPGRNHDGIFWLSVNGSHEKRAFTLSMFHQIRCLNIIRSSLVAFRTKKVSPDRLTSHCMNYLRQMVLCRSDLTLESGRDPVGPRTVTSDITHMCRDWGVVWEALEDKVAMEKED